MELVTPDIGLIFWMFISFLILLLILQVAAWKPIMKALESREDRIDDALHAAEKSRKEIEKVKADNQKILDAAKIEHDKLLKEAKNTKEKLIKEAREKAEEEGKKILTQAKDKIQAEKKAALNDIKKQVMDISIDIAEKILKSELSDPGRQKKMIEEKLKEFNLN